MPPPLDASLFQIEPVKQRSGGVSGQAKSTHQQQQQQQQVPVKQQLVKKQGTVEAQQQMLQQVVGAARQQQQLRVQQQHHKQQDLSQSLIKYQEQFKRFYSTLGLTLAALQ